MQWEREHFGNLAHKGFREPDSNVCEDVGLLKLAGGDATHALISLGFCVLCQVFTATKQL